MIHGTLIQGQRSHVCENYFVDCSPVSGLHRDATLQRDFFKHTSEDVGESLKVKK